MVSYLRKASYDAEYFDCLMLFTFDSKRTQGFIIRLH